VLTSLSIALGGKALKTPLFESSRVANPLIADAQLLVASAFCVGSEACTPGPLLLIVPILPVSADAETDDCAPMLKVQFWHDGVQRITLERCPEGTSSEEVLFGA